MGGRTYPTVSLRILLCLLAFPGIARDGRKLKISPAAWISISLLIISATSAELIDVFLWRTTRGILIGFVKWHWLSWPSEAIWSRFLQLMPASASLHPHKASEDENPRHNHADTNYDDSRLFRAPVTILGAVLSSYRRDQRGECY